MPVAASRCVSLRLMLTLRTGTILGAGLLSVLPGTALAADYVYRGPASTGAVETSQIVGVGTGTDKVTITTVPGGTVTAATAEGIKTTAVNGATTIDVGALVSGATIGVRAITSGSGAVTVTGAGDITGAAGIEAYSATGAVTVAGTGATTARTGTGIEARITGDGATADITITRSGAITTVGPFGIYAENSGSGGISIGGAGGLSAAVTGQGGIYAQGLGTGAAMIKTAAGGKVTATNGFGIVAGGGSGDATITAGDTVTGSEGAIGAVTSSGGAVSITTLAGAVVRQTMAGATFGAITALSEGDGAITIQAGADVFGTTAGILTQASGVRTTNITTSAGGAVSASAGSGISASAENGQTTINVGALVSGATTGVLATASGSGAVTVTGAGAITGAAGVVASSATGAITISGTGTTTGTAGLGIDAQITDRGAAADIVVNRSGAITSTSGSGVHAENNGSGKITIQGIGAVTAAGVGIETIAKSGATLIDLASSVSSTAKNSTVTAVTASSTTGNITVKTAAGVALTANAVTSDPASGIVARSQGGNVDIGGATGLAGAITASGKRATGVSGSSSAGNVTIKTASGADINVSAKGTSGTRSAYGVFGSAIGTSAALHITLGANVTATDAGTGSPINEIFGVYAGTADGTLNITTMAGVAVTGKTAIRTESSKGGTGAQTIDIGVGSTISGSDYAIHAESSQGGDSSNGFIKGGDATVNNAGIVKGLIRFNPGNADPQFQGLGTFNNFGTLALVCSQSNTGFALNNQSGGVLTGTGSFGDVVAEAGSLIRPGDRSLAPVNGVPVVGTLNTSTLLLNEGATVEIRADASGVNDKVAVSGAATLGGATLKLLATPTDRPSWAAGKSYTVLTAGSVSGTFALASDLAFLKPTAEYGAKTVQVTLTRNEVTFDSIGVTPTQKSVGMALQGQQNTQTVRGKAFIQAISSLTAPQALGALDTLSGSGSTGSLVTNGVQVAGYTGLVASQAQSSPLVGGAVLPTAFAGSDMPLGFGETLTAATAAGKAFQKVKTPAPAVVPRQTWRVWASFFGASHSTNANVATGTPGVTGHDWGGAAGLEVAFSPNLIAGVALGGSTSPFSVGKRGTFGDSTGGLGSLYGTATFDKAYVTGSLGYGRFETNATRVVAIPGSPSERQKAQYGTDAYTGFLELGYKLPVAAYVVTPFASIQPSVFRQHAATETSETPGALFGLSYRQRDTTSLPTSLCLQVERGFSAWGWDGLVEARAAWVHEFQPERGLRASFVSLPGASFTASGVAASEDLARISSTVTLSKASGISLFAKIGADLAANQRSYSGQGGIKLAW